MAENAFISWSGGKDCALACHRAMLKGMEVSHLLNMIRTDGSRTYTHGQLPKIIELQSLASGIPLIQKRTPESEYEDTFKNAVLDLSNKGITGAVFGTIDVPEHRDWDYEMCRGTAVKPCLPLWMEDQKEILRDFVSSGFEAVVVAVKADLLGEEWLGRKVDAEFQRILLEERKDITPCGEQGEYHTFVTNAPFFKKRIEILKTQRVLRSGYRFLEILDARLVEK